MTMPCTDADLARIRAELPVVEQCAYLNAGTLGPLPHAAIEAMRVEQRYDEHVRQGSDLWERLTEHQVRARGALTKLTGVAAEQIALMHTTHEGINTCLWGLDLTSRDRVLTTDQEHPGVTVPLRHVRDRTGCSVDVVAWHEDDPDAFAEACAAACTPSTRAIVLSHVSWVSGDVAPLRHVRDAVGDGVRVIVDGAQSAGVLAGDPADGWDAYTVSGQKWPCGPNGSGGLALVDPGAWRPTFGAYMQLVDPSDAMHSAVVEDARRFETSQESMVPLAGLCASIEWLVREVGCERAYAHARHLNEHARAALASAAGSSIASFHGAAHLLCVELSDARAEHVTEQLGAAGYSIRWLTPTRLRISIGAWTTPTELTAAADLIARAL